MKNKIYPFLLGLSCIVIVALVSFKNSEKSGEMEQMIIMVVNTSSGEYNIYISTSKQSEWLEIQEPKKGLNRYTILLSKIEEYQKSGWVIINTSLSNPCIMYTLERQKQ